MKSDQDRWKLEFGIEFVVELLLFLIPYGADQMGLPHNFWLGLACWVIAAAVGCRIIWILPFWPNKLNRSWKWLTVGALSVFVVFIFFKPIRSAYRKHLAEMMPATNQPSREATPFAFTESLPDTVTILLDNGAGIHIAATMHTANLEKERFTGILNLDGESPIAVYVENGILYADAKITDTSGHNAIQIKRNKIEVMPTGLDMNFSANAVEVVDSTRHPIFQMIRKRANVIQIAGLFVGKGGSVFDARPAKALFKYPSWQFLGQYTDQETESPQDQVLAKKYSEMRNLQLYTQVQNLCSKIRILGKEWDDAYVRNNQKAVRAMNSSKSDEEKKAIGTMRMAENDRAYRSLESRFNKAYRRDANLLGAELSRRVESPAGVLGPEPIIPSLMSAGVAAGPNPWNDVCDYLESLARPLH